MAVLERVANTTFIRSVLENYFKCEIEVFDVNAIDDNVPGQSYSSVMNRITISYSTKGYVLKRCLETVNQFDESRQEPGTLSMILKYFPETEFQAQFVRELNMFDCEIRIYNDVLPKLSTLVYREKIAPRLYYSSTHPQPMLLLEDLSALDYKGVERNYGLDLEHCLLVVEKLAYLHAASVVLQEQDSTMFQKFDTIVYPKTGIMGDLVSLSYDKVVETCGKVEELYRYVEKLKLAKDRILTKMSNAHRIHTKLMVLNHGDCYAVNIMFYYHTDGTVKDVAFVDYQLSCFGSPCIDLHYFLATSLRQDVRGKESFILDYYFQCLMKSLSKLRSATFPKRSEFDEDFRSFACCGLVASVVALAALKATKVEGASVQNFLEDDGPDSFQHHCFNNADYLKEMLRYLPFYDEMGVFDL
ncbi:hypothetical protein RI129_009542 [Pyrocoelia pectoralis]|uniref:CHK kinase-like domain-containing protein n=1 Tax=Pyrocoelia pectoralis TaxID=417401 RepID=A0AAN7V266_9COLE